MSSTSESPASFPARRALGRRTREQMQLDAVNAELQAALTREQTLLKDKREQSLRQSMLAQEFEHRLVNGLQLVVSLLSMQSRAATTPEAAAQLTIASRRVSALGRVHHRLHLLDQQDRVEFKGYLQELCRDLSGLLVDLDTGYAIAVEGDQIEIPTKSAIPLGFIVNELITNSMKYAKGRTTVRIDRISAGSHSLSVMDEGPGLPADFDPANSTGLGMKIIRSLVKQIGGTLQFAAGDNNRGTRFIVTFASM
jgi:two-component sensor histidine kinase